VTPSAPSSTTGAVHDRHRRPGDDAHTARDEFELLLRIGEVEEGPLGGEPARARGDIRAVI
jgi:hypothetical protein